MLTLPDPRHEAFARYLAEGHDFASAYVNAGYSVKNIKTRSQELSQNPAIRARAEYLKACLPHIHDLRDRFAPDLRLMPETRDQMLAWLWQVASASRRILPIQLRAATLFCRLQGWHQTRPTNTISSTPVPAESPHPPQTHPTRLSDHEKALLQDFGQQTLHNEINSPYPPPDALPNFLSKMADLIYEASLDDPQGRPLPDPAPIPGFPLPPPQTEPPSAEIPEPTDPQPPTPEAQLPSATTQTTPNITPPHLSSSEAQQTSGTTPDITSPLAPVSEAQRASVTSPGFAEPWVPHTPDAPPSSTPKGLRPLNPAHLTQHPIPTVFSPSGDSPPPSKTPDPQPLNPPNPQMGKNPKPSSRPSVGRVCPVPAATPAPPPILLTGLPAYH